jgi:hypothetical protein
MKKPSIALLALCSLFLLSNFQCEKETDYGEVQYLSYGTSFGECLGYCVREVVVSGWITFTKSGWEVDGALPDSSCSLTFIRSPLPDYLEEIDQDAFLALDETLGCPDCADGGAEWLELGFREQVKRVTFEYMNEPEELQDIILSMRELMESFNDCRPD